MSFQKIRRRKLLFFLTAIVALFALILLVKNLLVSCLLGFVGFYLLAPLVDRLERRGVSRRTAVLLPFGIFCIAGILSAQVLLPSLVAQFNSLKQDLPRYIAGSQRLTESLKLKASGFMTPQTAIEISEQVETRAIGAIKNVFDDLPEHISNSLTVLFLAPFLCIFMLLDGRTFIRQILSLVPNQFFELALNLQHDISSQMGSFIRARLLESLIVGIIVAVGLFIIDFKYALVLALVAALLNLIPYLGPVIGALPAYALAFLSHEPSGTYVALTLIYGSAQVVDAAFIMPILVARIVNLHPVTVVLSFVIGSQLMGILGMIISIPVTSALKVTMVALYQHLTQFREES